jgi:hypothetical protein
MYTPLRILSSKVQELDNQIEELFDSPPKNKTNEINKKHIGRNLSKEKEDSKDG